MHVGNTKSDLDASIAATSKDGFLTPKEVSSRLKVTPEQVRSLIRHGRMSAVDVGTGVKRPLYRIPERALDDFLNHRVLPNSLTHIRKAKRLPPVPDFFPHLK